MDAHELAALTGRVGVLDECGAVAPLRQLVGVGEQGVQRLVLADERARPFPADAGDALYVVHGVAHERQHVHHLVGPHAELLLHAVGVVPRAVVLRVVDPYPVADELEEVLVARHDHDVDRLGLGPARQRADDVVRLVALHGQHGHAQRLTRLVDPGNLFDQVVRHRCPVGLVVGVELLAKCRTADVECGGDVLWLLVVQQLAQHRDEAVHGVRGLAVGAGQAANGVIRAVHLRAAVDQQQAPSRWFAHRVSARVHADD